MTRVGADLARRVIQAHAVDASGKLVTNRALAHDKFIAWCARLPAGCLVAMEASSSAHHWARKGLSAIIVEQHQKASLAISDQAAILDHGTVVHSGKAQSLLEPPRLRDRWLGRRTLIRNCYIKSS